MGHYVISISRQFGSLGRPIAKKLAELLHIEFYDRDIVEKASEEKNISLKEASDIEERAGYGFMSFPLGKGTSLMQDDLFRVETETIRALADKEDCIIVGRCADSILNDHEQILKVFIYAPYADRIVNCLNELGMDVRTAKRMIQDVDKARDAYHLKYAGYLPNDLDHIDLMINSAIFKVDGTAEMLEEIVKKRFWKN